MSRTPATLRLVTLIACAVLAAASCTSHAGLPWERASASQDRGSSDRGSNEGASKPRTPLPIPTTTTTERPTERPTDTAPQRPSGRDEPSGTSECVDGSLEGCFEHDTMDDYVDAVLPALVQFYDTYYPELPHPSQYLYIRSGETTESACTDEDGSSVVDSDAAMYCGADETIYLGEDTLWMFYDKFGDAAPVLVIAHEWGHHVQQEMAVVTSDTNAGSATYENQADCIAGAFIGYSDEQGWLEYPDDVDDIVGLMAASGSAEGGDHGTAEERAQAIDLGWEYGLAACNELLPDTPVY